MSLHLKIIAIKEKEQYGGSNRHKNHILNFNKISFYRILLTRKKNI